MESSLGSGSVYVQDAPEDTFSEVHVVFTHVLVHRAGDDNETDDGQDAADNSTDDGNATVGGNNTADDDSTEDDGNATADGDDADDADEDDAGEWIELVNDTAGIDVDLLNVTGTRAAFLGEEDLEAGRYTQIRIVAIEAYGIDHDGNRTDITLSNDVLKVPRSFEVQAGNESRILLDIDLDRSLRETGQGWRMTPVIGKTIVDIVDDASSGEEVSQAGDEEELEGVGGE